MTEPTHLPTDYSNTDYSNSGRERAKLVAVAASAREHATHIYRLVLMALIAFAGFALVMATSLRAQEIPLTDDLALEMQSIITGQIDAFRADDAEAAYAYAAPHIKRMYPTAASFVAMVQQGYGVVYAPQSFAFLAAGQSGQGPALQVEFIAMDGQVWQGMYTFAEQASGDLMISGVYLRRQNAQQI